MYGSTRDITMRCEYLMCQAIADTRLTVPTVKPRAAFCEEHCRHLLAWAERYRAMPGAVRVERIEQD